VLALAQVATGALVEPLPRPQAAQRTGLPLGLMVPMVLPPLSARTFLCQAVVVEALLVLLLQSESEARLQELQQQLCLKSISTSAAQAQTEAPLVRQLELRQR
jgi:hypothetical protein